MAKRGRGRGKMSGMVGGKQQKVTRAHVKGGLGSFSGKQQKVTRMKGNVPGGGGRGWPESMSGKPRPTKFHDPNAGMQHIHIHLHHKGRR